MGNFVMVLKAPTVDIMASSTSLTDVQAAVDASSAGQVVGVPSGAATWTGSLTVDKAITLQGAGIGNTVITSGKEDADDYFIEVTAPSSGRVRVTGFEFNGNQLTSCMYVSGDIGKEVQVDTCKFVDALGRAVENSGLIKALFYNITCLDCKKTIDSYALSHRDYSWQNSLTLGTTSCVVVEDCTMLYQTWKPASAIAVTSQGYGARVAWRHNTITNENTGLDFFPGTDAHGNQEAVDEETNTGSHRGTRSLEWYENTITSNVGGGSSFAPTQIRGGVFIAYNNTYTGSDVGSSFEMREEDGPNRFDRFEDYPGYDMHWVWLWDNYSNETLMGHSYATDSEAFIVENTNLFKHAPQSGDPNAIPGRGISTPSDAVYPYTSLAYPHPWRS